MKDKKVLSRTKSEIRLCGAAKMASCPQRNWEKNRRRKGTSSFVTFLWEECRIPVQSHDFADRMSLRAWERLLHVMNSWLCFDKHDILIRFGACIKLRENTEGVFLNAAESERTTPAASKPTK